MARLLDFLFGCSHKHYSFPITTKTWQRRGSPVRKSTYIVCLDCGKQFPYDWDEMKIVTRSREGEQTGALGEAAETYAAKVA